VSTVSLDELRARKPRFRVPRGSCDTHCHVFGPQSKFPYAPNRRYTPEDAPKEMLLTLHGALGIERAVIVQASCHGTDNRALLDAIAVDPARYRGIAIADDSFTERDLQRLHERGVRGVRFNFVRHLGAAPDAQVFSRVLDRVKDLGWHVVLHMDAADIPSLSGMIRGLALPFVIDHMGRVDSLLGLEQPAFRALLELARIESCWIKVSGAERISKPPYAAAIPFARALLETAPDRVLWGTDFPHPNSTHDPDEAVLVDLLPSFGDWPALRRLLVENPARLYGFGD
jgi:2-pyrone-4,6-dicarboxylate lactonase